MVCQWVFLFISLFANSSKWANPKEQNFFNEDSPFSKDGFRQKKRLDLSKSLLENEKNSSIYGAAP